MHLSDENTMRILILFYIQDVDFTLHLSTPTESSKNFSVQIMKPVCNSFPLGNKNGSPRVLIQQWPPKRKRGCTVELPIEPLFVETKSMRRMRATKEAPGLGSHADSAQ